MSGESNSVRGLSTIGKKENNIYGAANGPTQRTPNNSQEQLDPFKNLGANTDPGRKGKVV